MADVHALPSETRQRQVWAGDLLSPYIVSGGLPSVPGGSLSFAAFACTGYVEGSDREFRYVSQDSHAVGPLNGGNGTYWLVLHADTSTVVTNWTRQGGTHYLWRLSASQPTLPTASTWLAQVTVAGGAITAVQDLRLPASFARAGYYDVTDPLYGATGDGSTNDQAAIQNCVNATKQNVRKDIYFPHGTYYLGTFAANTAGIDFSSIGDNIRIRTSGKVTITCQTTVATAIPRLFYLYNNNYFYCEPISFQDLGYDKSTITGAAGVYLSNLTTNVEWGNCTFERITCVDMVGGMFISANPVSATVRIRGIHIGQMHLHECYYGFHCQNDGDDVFIGNIYAYRCVRSYYCYGIAGHTIGRLFAHYPRPSTGQCLIARQVGGLNTRGITINYISRDSNTDFDTNFAHVSFQHVDLLGGEISDCTIDINVDDTTATNYYPVTFLNYLGSGLAEDAGASSNYVKDIHLSGSCNSYSQGARVVATYAAKRQLHWTPGLNFLPTTATLLDAFQLTQQSRAQTDIRWTASGGDPVLGNGTLTYDVDIEDGMCQLSIHLVVGSTTTFGVGTWVFDNITPARNAKVTTCGSWQALDSGTAFFAGVAKISATTDNVACYVNNNAAAVSAAVPFAWATGDTLDITIRYPLSG
jgi:hypothetical protein